MTVGFPILFLSLTISGHFVSYTVSCQAHCKFENETALQISVLAQYKVVKSPIHSKLNCAV
jgi:hypothetical protein